MIVPDTNLLIYAYDTTSPHHRKARKWWESALSGSEPVGIPWIVVLAFTRLMSHPTICINPMSITQVRQQVDQWLVQPNIRLLSPTEGTMAEFYDLLEKVGLGGNLSTDALIAAHAMEHGAIVYTNDLDFQRFVGLRWKDPLRGP
jgi:toxin-antitoxin system PIN domain toxin